MPLQEKGCHLLPDVRDMTLLRFSSVLPAERSSLGKGAAYFMLLFFYVAREMGDVSWSSGARNDKVDPWHLSCS